MKTFISAFVSIALFASLSAVGADQQVDLQTPRGSLVKIDIYNPGLPTALLMGPGQGCSARLDMYGALAAEAKEKGFTLVRLYWAYCVADPQNGNPSDDLSTEKEDFLTALGYVKGTLGFSDTNIFIGGKSLGTFVSYEIFQAQKSLPGLLMLTPVCTDSSDPNNHKNMFADYYPGLAAEARSAVLVQGNADPLCDTNHFQEFLKGKANNFISLVTKGDHGLGIKNPDGQYNAELGAKNLQAISKWIFSWLK
jgi:predicted alpha/beta-hydrolase family hydrolase